MNNFRHRRLRVICIVVPIALAALALLPACRPCWRVVSEAYEDNGRLPPLPSGFADDASRLNLTAVDQIWTMPADPAVAEPQLAALLKQAAARHLAVSIAGARHSMGGHTIAPGGIQIEMLAYKQMQLDPRRNVLRVGTGARWADVIKYLDKLGRSVKIMQSNNPFSVGGSLSVNCHGWQYGCPPIASTVEAFRIMLADGRILHCSRTENCELFSLALGGYGLFGVILDADLDVIPNERLRLEQLLVPADHAMSEFDRAMADNSDVCMTYARLNIVPAKLFSTVLINLFHPEEGEIPPLADPKVSELRRAIFRGSARDDYGKKLRWEAETRIQPWLSGRIISRNQLMNNGIEEYENRTSDTTDILHEYFVPKAGVNRLVTGLREIVLANKTNLLNVTIRYVDTDRDTFLRYADQPMFAFVMLYNQPRTAQADAAMEQITRRMIDLALAAGGRYYLPYRLHATPTQFVAAYPQAARFFELKRKYDPGELFQNEFYTAYAKPSAVRPFPPSP